MLQFDANSNENPVTSPHTQSDALRGSSAQTNKRKMDATKKLPPKSPNKYIGTSQTFQVLAQSKPR